MWPAVSGTGRPAGGGAGFIDEGFHDVGEVLGEVPDGVDKAGELFPAVVGAAAHSLQVGG